MEGKVIAITGGASGIGLATAKLLASRGARISIGDVSQESLDKAIPEIEAASKAGNDILATQLDVRDLASVNSWVKKTVDKFGKLNGAANLAGTMGKNWSPKSIKDLAVDDWEFVLAVNLTGVMNCLKEELKVMQRGGSIVNAASIAGMTGSPYIAAYCVSKWGVIGLTKVAAKEEGKNGIRVNAIAPGVIETPMLQSARNAMGDETINRFSNITSLGRAGAPEEIARTIAFLLSDESSYTTGTVACIDGGATS